MNEINVGSDFDDFLRSDGNLEAAEHIASKRVLAFQIREALTSDAISVSELARRMNTSRSSSPAPSCCTCWVIAISPRAAQQTVAAAAPRPVRQAVARCSCASGRPLHIPRRHPHRGCGGAARRCWIPAGRPRRGACALAQMCCCRQLGLREHGVCARNSGACANPLQRPAAATRHVCKRVCGTGG